MSLIELSRERERVRDLLRYYKPVLKPPKPADNSYTDSPFACTASAVVPQDDPPDDTQLLAHDPTLTAFAQLGAFRLNCQRSFISLMDHEHQYILAEATRSVSLNSPEQTAPGDEVYLGARILDMMWGVCPNTIQVFTALDDSNNMSTSNVTANQECYVMNDLSAIESFKGRPYVMGWPHMRFYAEVPIHSPTGHVIGTFCVVDDKPRDGLDKQGLAALNEISSAIMKHLQLVQMQHGLQRAGDMIKGLGRFVEGKSSTQEEWVSDSDTQRQNVYLSNGRQDSPEDVRDSPTIRTLSIPSAHQGVEPQANQSVSTFPSQILASPEPNIREGSSSKSDPSIATPPSSGQPRERKMSSIEVATQEALASHGMNHLFFRACGLIREAIDLDGVFFVDARQRAIRANADQSALKSHDKLLASMTDTSPIGRTEWTDVIEIPRVGVSSAMKSVGSSTQNGIDTEGRSDLLGSSMVDINQVYPRQIPLAQPTLRGLLHKYPHGHIFMFDEDGTLAQEGTGADQLYADGITPATPARMFSERSTEEAWARNLQSVCPGARALIFFPLWDPQRDHWFAGGLAWTTDPKGILKAEDLNYLAAFGSCIMSEKSRLDALQADRAKADFISSVSHELRSPLHGILAGTEVLQGTSTGPEQDDMIRIVTICGEVLLETVDQILEYSKVKNSATNLTSKADNSPGDFENVDLSVLVENVVDSVFAGHQYRHSMLPSKHQSTLDDNMSTAVSAGNTMIILTMEWRASWMFSSRRGCWKRILINLVGNSLKYTTSGFIHISLRIASIGSPSNAAKEILKLQIEDSGIGMSKDYLDNELYTPFAQENPMSAGTGLGLSIVHQLVQDLGGTVNIQSEVGYGTIADISVPSDPAPKFPEVEDRPLIRDIRARCKGLTLCLVAFNVLADLEPPTGILTPQQRRMIALNVSITTLVVDWFGMEVTAASTLSEAKGDFTIVLQSHIQQSDKPNGRCPLIVFEDGIKTSVQSNSGVFYLSQPAGPHKLARALEQSLEYRLSVSRDLTGTDDVPVSKGDKNPSWPHSPANPPLPQSVQGNHLPLATSRSEFPNLSPPPTASELQISHANKLLQDLSIVDSNSPSSGKPSLVLLVEDNPINLKILANHMKRAKENYITAQNGLEALQTYKLQHAAIKLIFMDISMPVMDGLTSTRQIRLFEHENSLPRTRIVAITCFSSHEYQKDALASGTDLFLVKPVPMKSLQPILDLDPEVVVVEEENR